MCARARPASAHKLQPGSPFPLCFPPDPGLTRPIPPSLPPSLPPSSPLALRCFRAAQTGVARLAPEKATFIESPGPGSYGVVIDKSGWTSNDLKIRRPVADGPPPGSSPVRASTGGALVVEDSAGAKRLPSAPSVPTRGQSYGYEETSDGKLVMQRPPDIGHSGMVLENRYQREWRSPKTFVGAKWDDTVGPAKYDPVVEATKQYFARSVDFGRSRVSREFLRADANPGPGQYTADLTAGPGAGPDARYLASSLLPRATSSQFASTKPRFEAAPTGEKLQPGPGHYVDPSAPVASSFARSRVPESRQFFGSTAPRSHQVDPVKLRHMPTHLRDPGPGAYEEPRLIASPKRASYVEALTAPFTTTSLRFRPNKHLVAVPGPGSYQDVVITSLATDVEKRIVSRNSVFGGTDARLRPTPMPVSPGPSTYSPPPEGAAAGPEARRQRTHPSSVFHSRTSRFSEPNASAVKTIQSAFEQTAASVPDALVPPAAPVLASKITAPPPGAYDPPDLWRSTVPRPVGKTEPFFSSKERFLEPKKSVETPGPPHYAARDPTRASVSAVAKVGFKSRTERFDAHTRKKVPGVGHYTIEDFPSTMIKRSYNVTVDLPIPV